MTQISSSINSSGNGKDIFIYEIPHTQRQRLCSHLDDLNVWNQLAVFLSLRPTDIQSIKRQKDLGRSPSDELLRIWGSQYNHTVTELFVVFKNQKLYQAMELLKDFVERKYHLYIPNSRPALSDLLLKDNFNINNEHSKKILNHNSSSGVSNSNNNSNDSSYIMSSTSNMTKSEQQEQQQEQSFSLNTRYVKEYASSLNEINYHELTAATNNWDSKYILGKGGFGTVYRGIWKYTEVAIKQIHYRGLDDRDSVKVQLQQSLNELKYLNSCRHDNVLPLYGYSIKGEKPCLVYQLMMGGSLENRLYSKKLPLLTWNNRINISLGTAKGINYLHTFQEKPLIHGDIKPANVLLDQCLIPKIGDFGLAREGPLAVNVSVEVTQVFGTKPYLPPEFLNLKKLSTQVDTYSFGVVLLETFTGLRAYDKNRANPLLTRHLMALRRTTDYKIEDLIDKRLSIQPAEQDLCKNMIQLGFECIAENPKGRPSMEYVLKAMYSYCTMGIFLPNK